MRPRARLLLLAALAACCTAPRAPAPPGPTTTPTGPSASTPPAPPTAVGLATPPPLPVPLPPPLPPPEEPAQPQRREPPDALDLLWSHRLNFAAGGAPLVTIRLMEGQAEIAFRPVGAARLAPRGAEAVALAAGSRLRARAREALPAALAHFPLLAQLRFGDRRALEEATRAWEQRGVRVRPRIVGGVYGISGKVIDNRRVLLLAQGDGSEAWARGFLDEAHQRHGERVGLFADLVTRPAGRVEVVDEAGRTVAAGDGVVALEPAAGGDGGFVVERVEHDVGYAAHGFEDRSYRGRLYLTLDASGRLAAVHALPLEELLRGLVPSEMPGGSPAEALKAQAVTARSNVLAQIGGRHLTDPYVLCGEVHCQAYRGEAAQAASTDAAVRATAGEALFGRADRSLVDAVYSAMCGGYGEDNDVVWGNIASSSLRGRPDLPSAEAREWAGGLAEEARLRAFLAAAPAAWCARARGARPDRYRWERRFSAEDMDGLLSSLGVGRVEDLAVTSRGVSGRARSLRATGSQGSATVHGELRIRKLLRNLPSAMAVVDRDGTGWVLRGGGWGHGAGMCQWGAVGRAEAGQGYREILRAYYSGAEVAKIY